MDVVGEPMEAARCAVLNFSAAVMEYLTIAVLHLRKRFSGKCRLVSLPLVPNYR